MITTIFNHTIIKYPHVFVKLEDTHSYVGLGFNLSLTDARLGKTKLFLDTVSISIQIANYLLFIGIILGIKPRNKDVK